METAKRECKACGKMYDYCHTEARNKFRWQDVACSPECGEKYFALIRETRSQKPSEPDKCEDVVAEIDKNVDAEDIDAKPKRQKYRPKDKTNPETI